MQYELSDPTMVSARAFDDEIVIAHFGTGVYYSLRFSAADIWLGLMAGVPVDRLIRALSEHSRGAADAFVDAARTFIGSLEAEQLIRSVNRSVDSHWEAAKPTEPYDAPVLERFTDMEELLLLDPIHDVGRTGWTEALRSKSD